MASLPTFDTVSGSIQGGDIPPTSVVRVIAVPEVPPGSTVSWNLVLGGLSISPITTAVVMETGIDTTGEDASAGRAPVVHFANVRVGEGNFASRRDVVVQIKVTAGNGVSIASEGVKFSFGVQIFL